MFLEEMSLTNNDGVLKWKNLQQIGLFTIPWPLKRNQQTALNQKFYLRKSRIKSNWLRKHSVSAEIDKWTQWNQLRFFPVFRYWVWVWLNFNPKPKRERIRLKHRLHISWYISAFQLPLNSQSHYIDSIDHVFWNVLLDLLLTFLKEGNVIALVQSW